MVGAKSLEALINLRSGGAFGLAVNLGHEENLLPVTILEGFAHPFLAASAIVVPTVVHEGQATVHGRSNDPATLLLAGNLADVRAAKPHRRDLFPCFPKCSVDHVILPR